ncbi:MAG TPA: DUF3857 and transglutaminase domain-containing protein [Bacteroidales bacterium]|nr:DUF3857 and transglutaminase domain-containing protein [Bacteroidales bacterium]
MKRLLLLFCALILTGGLYAQDIRALIANAGDSNDYPSAGKITIFDTTLVDVQETGLSYVHIHKLDKILTAKGALDLSVIKYGYDPLSAYVDIKMVKVHHSDGRTTDFDVTQVIDYPAPARAIYWGAREKMLEIGRLYPGDAVEVVFFKKGYTYALLAGEEDDERYIPPMRGHYYDIVEFFSNEPVLEKCYEVIIPSSKELQYEFYNGEVRSSVKFREDTKIYSFTKKDIMPMKRESGMVAWSDVAPKLLLSTSPDWYAKSRWFYGVNEDFGSFESTPEIDAKVNEILKDAKDEMDSIAKLTHWCADEIRYSGISMGEGEGYTLHTGEMTFTDRCGVCKDKAGMLITMLRAAGFKSYAAMTMAGSRIDYIPADQFNHSITVVQLHNGEYMILDPTWVPFVRELWSSREQQQNYLMGLPEGADLMETPISPPENHYLYINGNSEIKNNGTLTGTFTIEAEGQSDAAVRGVFTYAPIATWHDNLEKELLKVSPNAILKEVTHTKNSDYQNTPVKMTYTYEIPNYAMVTEDEVIFTPFVAKGVYQRAMGHLYTNTSYEERVYPFRTGCSLLLEMNEEVKLPKYKEVVYLPEAEAVSGKGADYSGSYEVSKRILTFNQKVTIKKRIFQPEDWSSFKTAVNNQRYMMEEPVILAR